MSNHHNLSARTAFHYWLIAVLAMVVVALLSCCATINAPYSANVVKTAFPDSATYSGITFCDIHGHPVIFISKSVPDGEATEFVEIHEQVHVQQSLHYPGGCRAMGQRYARDPEFRFNTELAAHCVQIKWVMERRGADNFVPEPFIGFMRNIYGQHLSLAEVTKRVMKCVDKVKTELEPRGVQ